MKSYRPLPDCLTIKSSNIEGLGLFATTDIEKNTVLGISHILYQKEYIRTPLGGFINHSIKAGDELTLTYTLYNVTSYL